MRIIKPSTEILGNIDGYEILREIERAGRVCYKSEDKISDSSTLNFMSRIINSGHLSVLEHVSISVRIICDRGVSHELVRHRLCSFSQESTRYCNYSRNIFGNEITVIKPFFWSENSFEYLEWKGIMENAEQSYLKLLKLGSKLELARSVLPNSLKTELIMTCNLREWRHIFALRCASKAHPQMREIMIPLRADMQERIPVIFN